MSKRKYRKGPVICSLDQLAQQDVIWFNGKVYHIGWFGSWQFNWVYTQIKRGQIFSCYKGGPG